MENVPLDSSKVPKELRSLIPLAEKWGISDDGFRGDAINKASDSELEDLVQRFDEINDQILSEWFEAEDLRKEPSEENVAFIFLCEAVDLARIKIKNRKGVGQHPTKEEIARFEEFGKFLKEKLRERGIS